MYKRILVLENLSLKTYIFIISFYQEIKSYRKPKKNTSIYCIFSILIFKYVLFRPSKGLLLKLYKDKIFFFLN